MQVAYVGGHLRPTLSVGLVTLDRVAWSSKLKAGGRAMREQTSAQRAALDAANRYRKAQAQERREAKARATRDDRDVLTRRLSAFPTFQALLDAPGHYRPTILCDGDWAAQELADEYDLAQAAR